MGVSVCGGGGAVSLLETEAGNAFHWPTKALAKLAWAAATLEVRNDRLWHSIATRVAEDGNQGRPADQCRAIRQRTDTPGERFREVIFCVHFFVIFYEHF